MNVKEVIKILKRKNKVSMLEGVKPKSPFYILISTVLSARNRDEMTIIATKKLFSKYKTPREIANAPTKKLEPLIKQSGFYKTKAKRIKEISKVLLEEYGGRVPGVMSELTGLPGVGRKTAGCVLVYAFGVPAIPVDVHVHRISNRLGWVRTKTPEETEKALMALVPRRLWLDVNEVLVVHGQTVCKPIKPDCGVCPVFKLCRCVGV